MFNMGSLEKITPEQEEKDLKQAFKVFDRTGNGYITCDDLRSVLQCLGEQLTEHESNWIKCNVYIKLITHYF